MIVSDLKTVPTSERRPSTRKHEVLRKPTARNAIVRDRETGAYAALVDPSVLGDSLNAVNLRLNAIELNVSTLMRNDSVSRGHAAPMQTSDVSPMDVARAKRDAKEQSKAAPVSHPLPVAGNEALVLPAPEPIIVPVGDPSSFKPGDTEPTLFNGKSAPLTSGPAANDEVLMPAMVSSDLASIVKEEDLPYMEQLADAYQMDLVEASEILCKEYRKREIHCLQTHGQPRKEVRADRYLAQKGLVDINPALQIRISASVSGFKAWSGELIQREQEWLLVADKRRDAPLRAPAPYTKGEAAYRKKAVVHRAASERRANPHGYAHVQSVAKKLHTPGTGVTTRSQVAAITTWSWETYQRGRKLFGMEPTVRGAVKRIKYEVTDIIDNAVKPAKDEVAAPLLFTSQAELVRRYQRTGGGY
jgi:hypothetical protein